MQAGDMIPQCALQATLYHLCNYSLKQLMLMSVDLQINLASRLGPAKTAQFASTVAAMPSRRLC